MESSGEENFTDKNCNSADDVLKLPFNARGHIFQCSERIAGEVQKYRVVYHSGTANVV